MSNSDDELEKRTRFRSPPYPMFDVGKAVERATELLKLSHHHWVGISVLAEAWGMKSPDGKVWRAAAALIQYGLIASDGSGKTRKFQVTDAARRIIQDSDPSSPKRIQAHKRAALSPMIHKELWEKFGSAKGLSDTILRTYLTLDRREDGEAPYSEVAANDVIEVYRRSLDFAGLSDAEAEKEFSAAKYGDLATPAVATDAEDKLLLNQPLLTDPFRRPVSFDDVQGTMLGSVNVGGDKAPISIQQIGGRLELNAEVDLEDIGRLRDMLAKYEEILKLMK